MVSRIFLGFLFFTRVNPQKTFSKNYAVAVYWGDRMKMGWKGRGIVSENISQELLL